MNFDIYTHGGVTRGCLLISFEVDDYRSEKMAIDEKELKELIQNLQDQIEHLKQFTKDF